MKYKISADTIDSIDKCKFNYSCLSGKKDCLCEVNKSIDDKIVMVNPRHNDPCDYLMSFGNSYICNCPARAEIYKLYGI